MEALNRADASELNAHLGSNRAERIIGREANDGF